jgi:hypothetical protein
MSSCCNFYWPNVTLLMGVEALEVSFQISPILPPPQESFQYFSILICRVPQSCALIVTKWQIITSMVFRFAISSQIRRISGYGVRRLDIFRVDPYQSTCFISHWMRNIHNAWCKCSPFFWRCGCVWYVTVLFWACLLTKQEESNISIIKPCI